MPLTKSDVARINEAVRSGDIEEARRIIQDSDDPRTTKMLATLNAKYPPPPTPRTPQTPPPPRKDASPAVDPLAAAKSLIAQKRYDEAEALLWQSDAPEADALLKKLKLVQTITVSPEKTVFQVKAKAQPQSVAIPSVWLYGAGAALVVVVLAALLVGAVQQNNKVAHVKAALLEACVYVTVNVNFSAATEKTPDEARVLCATEAPALYDKFPDTVTACYEDYGDITQQLAWMACIVKREGLGGF